MVTAVERARQRHIVLEALHNPNDSLRLWTAVMLSPTLAVCRQLLKGEPVPQDQLDHTLIARMASRRVA